MFHCSVAVPDVVITTSSKKMAKKLDWKVVDKVEDSGRGYDRIFSDGEMIATVENGFTKVGDEVAIKGGRVHLADRLLNKYPSPVINMDEQDISLEDLEKSEQMLKDSLFKIGHMAGSTNEQLEADWQLLKLEASSRDIHIEEL
jgi:hypothetical protein